VSRSSTRVEAASWVVRADPPGLLYGAIVSAAVLATISAHADGSTFVGVGTALVLVVYWMAHVYINTLSRQFAGDTRHFLLRLRTASVHETSVLKGGVPAIVVYAVASWAGLGISSSAAAAVYFSVVLLGAVGYLGAHQAGLRGRIVVLEVAGAASFGLLIVAAKTLLH